MVDSTEIAKPPARRLDHLRASSRPRASTSSAEVVAEFERPVMLYSIGKDSSVLLRLAQKAFHPGPIPFPLLHIDTTYKFREMIEFRDRYATEIGARLIVHTNDEAIADGTQPFTGRHAALLRRCSRPSRCSTRSRPAGYDAAFGGARRDEERSRAQGADLLAARRATASGIRRTSGPSCGISLNGRVRPGESIRVFPLSNWTELDVWNYIQRREHSRSSRSTSRRSARSSSAANSLLMLEQPFVPLLPGEKPQRVMCRMRSLGCSPCTGAVRSDADTVAKIIAELIAAKHSERQLRVIDHDQDGSMELKKREGYF